MGPPRYEVAHFITNVFVETKLASIPPAEPSAAILDFMMTTSRFYLQRWICFPLFFFSSRRRHTRCRGDWSSDVCSSDLCHRSAKWSWGMAMRSFSFILMAIPQDHLALRWQFKTPRGRKQSLRLLDRRLRRLRLRCLVADRSEERRGGKEWRSRWSPYH